MKQFRQEMEILKRLEEYPEWPLYKQHLQRQINKCVLYSYHQDANPDTVARLNEQTRFFQNGLMRAVGFMDDEIARCDAQIKEKEGLMRSE